MKPVQQSAVHCGSRPPALFGTGTTECVLPPGHPGSHADEDGCRWWINPAPAPAPVPVAADGTLRQAIAALAHLYERYADNATIPADQRAVYRSAARDITDLINPKADT